MTPAEMNKPLFRRADRYALLLMMLVALTARVAIIYYCHTYDDVTSPYFSTPFGPKHDHFAFGFETGAIARSIADGHGFASPFGGQTGYTAWIAPVYPYLCALVFKRFGIFSEQSAIVLLIINSLFAALTCPYIVRIGERTVGRSAALAAGWIWAAGVLFMRWPTTLVWDTSLSALLLAVAFYQTLRLEECEGVSSWIKYGLLWGSIALINPSLLTILLISGVWLILRHGRRGLPFVRHAVLAAAVFIVVIAPWLVRNRVVLGRWLFIRDNAGYELSLGNYPSSNGLGWFGIHPTQNKWQYEKFKQMGEVAYIADKQHTVLNQIRDNPSRFLKLSANRVYAFWYGTYLDYQPVSSNMEPWRTWMYWPVSLLAIAGVWLAVRSRVPGAGLIGVGILLYPLAYYVTYAQPRYRHAVEPEMLLTGMYLLFWPLRLLREHRAVVEAKPAAELEPVTVLD